jgi:hypothetical protein
MRQIHAAIEHLRRGDFECAITLAGAAEGILPDTDKPHFRQKVKAFAQREDIKAAGGATGENDYINWLKHGSLKVSGPRIENATIPAEESVVVVWRAISKFHAVYDDMSPQMQSFHKWALDWLEKDKASQTG